MRHHTVTDSRDAVFHALADPTRRAVLDYLRRGNLPAGRIAQLFPISRPAVSKHLRLLRQAGLVSEQRIGRHRNYHLNAVPLTSVESWLSQYRKFWEVSLAGLKQTVEATAAARPSGRRTGKRSKS